MCDWGWGWVCDWRWGVWDVRWVCVGYEMEMGVGVGWG